MRRLTRANREFLECTLTAPGGVPLHQQPSDAGCPIAVMEKLTHWGYIHRTRGLLAGHDTGRKRRSSSPSSTAVSLGDVRRRRRYG